MKTEGWFDKRPSTDCELASMKLMGFGFFYSFFCICLHFRPAISWEKFYCTSVPFIFLLIFFLIFLLFSKFFHLFFCAWIYMSTDVWCVCVCVCLCACIIFPSNVYFRLFISSSFDFKVVMMMAFSLFAYSYFFLFFHFFFIIFLLCGRYFSWPLAFCLWALFTRSYCISTSVVSWVVNNIKN